MSPIWLSVINSLTMVRLNSDLIGIRTQNLMGFLLLRVDEMALHVLHILKLVAPLHSLFLQLKFFELNFHGVNGVNGVNGVIGVIGVIGVSAS